MKNIKQISTSKKMFGRKIELCKIKIYSSNDASGTRTKKNISPFFQDELVIFFRAFLIICFGDLGFPREYFGTPPAQCYLFFKIFKMT